MIRVASLALMFALVLGSGCKKEEAAEAKPAPAALTLGTVGADGVRRIPVEANAKGYAPDHIAGKPGEKLGLVFTRTDDTECISQLKVANGKLVDLPKGKAVEIAVTVPASGEVGFACGMDMYRGVIVATPSS